MTYRPLPKCVTIQKSAIEGLGLFATEDISEGTIIGITHVQDQRFENGFIRTPLGGFFNHSDDPNCEARLDDDMVRLHVIKDIKAGEEITSKYWLYNLTKPV